MSDRRRGLGRGLGALIPAAPAKTDEAGGSSSPSGPSPMDVLIPERQAAAADAPDGTPEQPAPDGGPQPAPVAGAHFAELPVDSITPNPRQPRQVFDEEAMGELVHSVREIGLLQPVVVRPLGDDRYELIMGERRWRAARQAGLDALPAIVRSTDDDAMLRDALLENLHRSQLNPLEEAAAYDQLLQDFGCTHDQLAGKIGRSRPQISNTLRLLKLPPLVQRRVAAGVLSAGHARALLGLEEAAAQERLAQRIVAEGLSVRTVEEIVALGGDGAKERRPPRPNKPVAPKLETLATRLSDRFETRVKVDLGRSKGRIVVEFASIDDLERIVGLMAPGGESAPEGDGEPAHH
ncbi:MAG TPA: ParB/RepB/Spo0J family partition protein [Candidatus Eisenbacteria bacterium]|nr:ParB/RepB/Spo0J family partition protein [Candidatus Eisenbacteria bacterium]